MKRWQQQQHTQHTNSATTATGKAQAVGFPIVILFVVCSLVVTGRFLLSDANGISAAAGREYVQELSVTNPTIHQKSKTSAGIQHHVDQALSSSRKDGTASSTSSGRKLDSPKTTKAESKLQLTATKSAQDIGSFKTKDQSKHDSKKRSKMKNANSLPPLRPVKTTEAPQQKNELNNSISDNTISSNSDSKNTKNTKTADPLSLPLSAFYSQSPSGTDAATTGTAEAPQGIVSKRPLSFFVALQSEVDKRDTVARCERYGWNNNNDNNNTSTSPRKAGARKIYLGALMADEPWELLEIMAAETRGVLAGIVLVESNRTQSFMSRPLLRTSLHHQQALQGMFSAPVSVKTFVNEDPELEGIPREHVQRQVILKGWKEMGMKRNDIGYLADLDETFTRDVLRAVQTCPNIPFLQYDQHRCKAPQAKLTATTRVWETIPDCITEGRVWGHPDMVMGKCLEGIADASQNPPAVRKVKRPFVRQHGYGLKCSFTEVTDDKYPSWNAADFRKLSCFTKAISNTANGTQSIYTGFHFHNFFSNLTTTRNKYKTYGHQDLKAFEKPLEELQADNGVFVRCIQQLNDTEFSRRYIQGGYEALMPELPLYFHDVEYRKLRQATMKQEFHDDEQRRQKVIA